MRIVLDASVAVAAAKASAPNHVAALARVRRILRGTDEIVVPSLFIAEVSGALARAGMRQAGTRAYVARLTRPSNEVRPLDEASARRAAKVAFATRLRGPDAVYVALAADERIPLCSLDEEMSTRGARLCRIIRP
jgi:predicted nucleic acid-binding protein